MAFKRSAAAKVGASKKQKKQQRKEKLPVSTLCGFLGAGKTTLLKNILESNQAQGEDGLKFAVIVNDLAELNIDRSLIDQSQLVQSDDVIGLQNGCVCCTLQNDLVDQITKLAQKNTFDYMIVEASGVAEPAELAKLFETCQEDHDHDQAHHGHANSLDKVARLDTCVTVVDSGEFFNNFDSIKQGPKAESYPQLMVEQIEYANVIILNKTDLVSEAQLSKIREHVEILNPKAKIITACESKIDVAEVVNSSKYKAADFAGFNTTEHAEEPQKDKVVVDTLGSTMRVSCAQHYGITSIVYKARKPFHPVRFDEDFVQKYFKIHEKFAIVDELKKGQPESEREAVVLKEQEVAKEKRQLRKDKFGDLFRSKGFVWLTNRHDMVGMVSQASGVMTIEFPQRWNATQPNAWTGTEEEKAAMRKDWVEPYADRRQDLVFIGKDLKEGAIQALLDSCLLTDEEMAMGLDGWKAAFGDVLLDNADEDSDDGESEEEEEKEKDEEK